MHVILIVIGLLLLVFGGGCTLIFLIGGVIDPSSMMADVPLLLTMWVPLGLIPGGLGWLLFRRGLRIDREKRKSTVIPESVPPESGS